MSIKSTDQTVITAISMVSSLGSVVPACAAARAGLNRFRAIDKVVPDPGEIEPALVMASPVESVSGTEDYGRLIHLSLPALKELMIEIQLNDLDLSRTELIVIFPPPEYRPSLDDIESTEIVFLQGVEQFFRQRLYKWIGNYLQGLTITIVEGGHAGCIGVFHDVLKKLEQGKNERYIILGVDSYLDSANLDWLAGSGRLKLPNMPAGLIPGEGAAVVVLEATSSAKRRNVPFLSYLGPVSYQEASFSGVNDKNEEVEEENIAEHFPKLSGDVLSNVIKDAIKYNPNKDQKLGTIITDLNGEPNRAKYFANSLINVGDSYPRIRDLSIWCPAENFGDVGAATGVFHICLAVRAFQRGYAKGDEIIICNTSDDGSTGAMLLHETV